MHIDPTPPFHVSALAECVLDDLAMVGMAYAEAAHDPDKSWAPSAARRKATQTLAAWSVLVGLPNDQEAALDLARHHARRGHVAHVTPF